MITIVAVSVAYKNREYTETQNLTIIVQKIARSLHIIFRAFWTKYLGPSPNMKFWEVVGVQERAI